MNERNSNSNAYTRFIPFGAYHCVARIFKISFCKYSCDEMPLGHDRLFVRSNIYVRWMLCFVCVAVWVYACVCDKQLSSSNKRAGRIPKWCSINGCVCSKSKIVSSAMAIFYFVFFVFLCCLYGTTSAAKSQQTQHQNQHTHRTKQREKKNKTKKKEITKAAQQSFHRRRILFQVFTSEPAGKWKSFM